MLSIRSSAAMARALDSPIDPQLRELLVLRRDQLLSDTGGEFDLGDLVDMAIVQLGDTVDAVEAALNYPVFTEPAFEWVRDHSGWLEGVIVTDDTGSGIAIFVPDAEGVDPVMLQTLRDQATYTNNAKN